MVPVDEEIMTGANHGLSTFKIVRNWQHKHFLKVGIRNCCFAYKCVFDCPFSGWEGLNNLLQYLPYDQESIESGGSC